MQTPTLRGGGGTEACTCSYGQHSSDCLFNEGHGEVPCDFTHDHSIVEDACGYVAYAPEQPCTHNCATDGCPRGCAFGCPVELYERMEAGQELTWKDAYTLATIESSLSPEQVETAWSAVTASAQAEGLSSASNTASAVYKTPSESIATDSSFTYNKGGTKSGSATYTITEQADGDLVVYIDMFDVIGKSQAGAYGASRDYTNEWFSMPGDIYDYAVSVVNNSDTTYTYKENSLVVAPGQTRTGTVKSQTGFDGQELFSGRAFYPSLKSFKYNNFGNLAYEAQLAYILSFFGGTETSLDTMPAENLLTFSQYKSPDGSYNDVVSQFANDMLFNKLLGITFDNEAYPLNASGNSEDAPTVTYSIAAHMRGETAAKNAGEMVLREAFGEALDPGETVTLENIRMAINAAMTRNLFAGYSYLGYIAFELEAEKETAYTVEHQYYTSTNGGTPVLDGGTTYQVSGQKIDTEILTNGIERVTQYGGNDYRFTSVTPDPVLTLAEDAKANVITLRYDRSVTDTTPTPDPDPGKPATPVDPTDPTPDPEPTVVVPEEQPPLANLPEIPETPTEVIIIDEEVPLGNLPQTGAFGIQPGVLGAVGLSLAALGIFFYLRRKQNI